MTIHRRSLIGHLVVALFATLSLSAAAAGAAAPFTAGNGKCLDLSGPDYDSRVNGGRVQMWDCHGGPNQQWHWDGARIIAGNGKCLDLSGPDYDSRVNGGRVQSWDCHGGPNQNWHWDGARLIAGNGKCLDLHGPDYDSRVNGGRVQSWDCHGGPNQNWQSSAGASSNASPPAYTSANKVGGATLSNLVCNADNNFPDLAGNCWKCPDGYSHDNPLLRPTDGKVCKKPGQNVSKDGWNCMKPGGFGFPPNCYKCPGGSDHDSGKTVSDPAVCRTSDSYSSANKQNRTAGCSRGFLDPIDGGSCWECPGSAPVRNLKTSVKSDKACMTNACGAFGQRPCQVTERIPSCNSGLLEDLIKDKCVSALSGQALCRELVNAMKRQPSPVLTAWERAIVVPIAKAAKGADAASKQVMLSIAKGAKSNSNLAKYVAEMNRLRNQVTVDKIKGLFSSPDLVCGGNGNAILNAITAAGLKPGPTVLSQADFIPMTRSRPLYASVSPLILAAAPASSSDKHFYMEIGFTIAGAAGVGIQESLSFVTDFGQNTATLWSYGPSVVTNVNAGIIAYFNFYPAVSRDDFGGDIQSFSSWNWELGMAGGEGADVGATFVFDQQMGFQGLGFLVGVGAGVLPADGSFAANYSFMITH